MPEGALNVLSQNDKGFFLMVEAGAVDWAAHANNLPRIAEEQVEFNHTVYAVVDWLEANTSWERTLVIVTTDHGNGLLQGPDASTVAYSPAVNQDAGAQPLVSWNSGTLPASRSRSSPKVRAPASSSTSLSELRRRRESFRFRQG